MASLHGLSVFDRPPEALRELYKKYQKLKGLALDDDVEILDPARGLTGDQKQKVSVSRWQDQKYLAKASSAFADLFATVSQQHSDEVCNLVYEHEDMPGLFLIPSLLSPQVQTSLLSCVMHRDLSNSAHKTNLHMHYDLSYPPRGDSFFTYAPSGDATFIPKDTTQHNTLSISQALNKKLRWITLGGQYDWTEKRYPAESPPQFPSDIAKLLQSLFPRMIPEAAIVNFYSPGDTLSLHRDVSEESEQGLASLSIGCEAVFVAGRESIHENDGVRSVVVRLRSGDAVFMAGTSRFAWHGIPQIIPSTCPSWLESWPAMEYGDANPRYEQWEGWMRTKRVNLNVRQMWG
ncbi:MAG: hypothetical protein Q9165_006644 [Trypethelium subeluteriae]